MLEFQYLNFILKFKKCVILNELMMDRCTCAIQLYLIEVDGVEGESGCVEPRSPEIGRVGQGAEPAQGTGSQVGCRLSFSEFLFKILTCQY